MSNATKGLALLFILAVPIFLITASVTWAVNDLRLYSYGFDQYKVSAVTGIEKEGLMEVTRDIRAYFNSRQEPLAVRAEVFGQEKALFNPREVVHMRDVKHLIWGVYAVGAVTGAYLLGIASIGLIWKRNQFVPLLCPWVLWGGGVTVGMVVVVGLISLVAFDALFLLFHQLSFANDFWRLEKTDYLIMMFPQGFWFDATLFVALASIGQALVLSAASAGYLLLRRRRARREVELLWQESEKAAGI